LIAFNLGILVISLFISVIFTKVVRDLAVAKGWVIAPTLDRHLHSRPLPPLGGVAIFFSFLIAITAALLVALRYPALNIDFSRRILLTILLPGTLIFLLGIYDDFCPVGPYFKFSIQAIAGTLLFAGGLRILDLPLLFGHHRFSWFVGLPLTILWVLAITNAFNLIDGLDGLAAGSAFFSTVVVFVVALVSQANLVSLMALALAGAILGFLRFNFSPATILLGDCGSLFIGFMLSALALQGAAKAPTVIAVSIPVVSFGLPILETSLSIVRRFLSGRPVFIGDREHIHHKLLQRGLSQRQVVITLYAVSAVFALLSLFLLWPAGGVLGLVLALLGLGVWVGVQHLGYVEFGELRRVAQRSLERQTLINNLAMRRATEELKVAKDYPQVCRILTAALRGNDFDAFDLRLRCEASKVTPLRGLRLISGWEDAPCLRWTNPDRYYDGQLDSAWSLTVDLATAGNICCGSMTIYRQHAERDLQLDINLLSFAFPRALADALDRTITSEPEMVLISVPASELVISEAS
jgi:UDP-GlcNAc:undecaprenyl-phosphate/decaprenyl-phosphate GlcNAc-1-phosphate transferase